MYLPVAGSSSAFSSSSFLRMVLPNGNAVVAQLMSTPAERAAGQQFRSEPAMMLFVHPKPGPYQYHMKNVRFPLDFVWCDSNGIVQRISTESPGRTSVDGNTISQYVIEAPSGFASQNNLKIGDQIRLG
jgi:uncharacterized membrane protein (UPF0127 family)